MPIFAVVTANEINQRLLGMICAAPLEIVTEQFSVPPSDLVVGEIPYSVCTRFVRDDRFFGLGYHPFFDRWIKRIGPEKSRSPTEVEIGQARKRHVGRAESAGSVEAPGAELRGREKRPVIRRAPRVFLKVRSLLQRVRSLLRR